MKEKKTGQSKLGTIIGILLCVILVPILIVNVTMIIKGYTNSSKVPTFAGYAPMIVLTDSMYPTIESGDLIIIKTIEPGDVKEGDIVSFFDPDGNGTSVVTHRILKVNSSAALTFTTRGDANNAEDPTPVPAENIVGIYRTRIAGAGNVAMFLQTTPGLIVCVAVPMVLLVGYELIRRKKYEKANRADTDALLAELEALRAQAAKQQSDQPEQPEQPDQPEQPTEG